jgi:hypothetical protein
MDKTKLIASFVTGALAALVVAAGVAGARADDTKAQGACAQWEVMAEEQAVVTAEKQEYGKPIVKKAPAGWEPFALGHSGLLVFRRCAK